MRDVYSLEFPAVNVSERSNDISPEVLLLCSVIYAFVVSSANYAGTFIICALFPAVCLVYHRIKLIKINIFNIIMIITLALTWPDFLEGIITGLIIALRVNMIYIVFASIVFPLGLAKIYAALFWLPEKLRILIVLTLRGIYILHDRLNTAITAVKLRAPGIHGVMKFRVFAYILGSVLLQGYTRSERMMLAIECRGGFAGFSQSERSGLTGRDMAIFVIFMLYIGVMLYA